MPFPKDPIKADEARKKMSQSAKKRFENPEAREKHREIFNNICTTSNIYRKRFGTVPRPFHTTGLLPTERCYCLSNMGIFQNLPTVQTH